MANKSVNAALTNKCLRRIPIKLGYTEYFHVIFIADGKHSPYDVTKFYEQFQ